VQNQIYGYFGQIIEHFDNATLEHEIDLNILIDGILFGKQGLIHPRIISPQYLIKNSKLIKEQIPYAEFLVSSDEQEMDQLIKISNLRIAYSNNRSTFFTFHC